MEEGISIVPHMARALVIGGVVGVATWSGSMHAQPMPMVFASRSPVPGPAFIFPSSGTSYPYNGTYMFQVQAINGAKGYLWSFIQGGMIVYQNLATDGALSSTSYTVRPGSAIQRRLHPGDLQVSVRA